QSDDQPEHIIGASIAEVMEKEYVTSENKEYFQGTNVPKTKASGKMAEAFGDQAYKPYENKSFTQLQEKHHKKFSFNNKEEKAANDNYSEDVKDFSQNQRENAENPNDRKVVKIENENNNRDFEEEKQNFKVNLKDNFFDENDHENTQMDIHVKNMDSSKAAIGFTRSLPALKNDDDEQKKKKLFSFADSAEEQKNAFDDYNSPADTDEVMKDLKSMRTGLFVRIGLTSVIFATLLYLGFSYFYKALPLMPFMFPEDNLQIFLAISLGFVILAALVCNTVVGGGLISLFTLKPDSDSPVALAVLATIAQGVALVALPERLQVDGVHMYFSVAVLGLLFNLFGKVYMTNRIIRNFKIISGNTDKFSIMLMKDKMLAKELTKGQNIDNPSVLFSSKTSFPTGFLNFSYTEDYSENINKITTPLFLVFGVVLSIITFVLEKDIFIALTVFNAMMCICAPLTTTIIGNKPLNAISKKLSKEGAVISGYQALEDFDDVTTITVDANELFTGGTVILHGIKAFSESRIEEAIIDAASVSCKASGLLMDIFMEMIEHKQNLIKDVDNLIYEDEMGISAWVDGKRVLIGNRQLMTNHGINPPDIAYENKFRRDGREVVYLANSGELTAMFVISYKGSEEMADYLNELAIKGVSLSVYTTDPNITSKKIQEIFEYPANLITIMSSKVHADFNEAACDRDKAPAKIIYTGSLVAKIKAICAVISGKGAIVLGTILQLIGIVFGYAIVAFLSFTGKMPLLSFEILIGYQLIWGFLVSVLPSMRKY
ncbi:MAG: hypothetical protein RR806_03365, partial [Oscillospiraceae bacterium]